MPTPTGLPKPGEIWEKRTKLPEPGGGDRVWKEYVTRFQVISRSRGDYWAMHVKVLSGGGIEERVTTMGERARLQHWVDCAWWMRNGELHYIKAGDL
jgi:hypothetical protein